MSRKLPKLVPIHAHLAADYLLAGSFFAAGTWFWRKNPRAALAALICGGSALGLALLTTTPGGRRKPINPVLHGKLEIGLAAAIATMPEFLRFENDREKNYFLTSAAGLTVLSNLTRFSVPQRIRRSIPKAG
jgi:hypothetical protein